MTIIYAAATAPVNPPGTTTVLSLSQLYAGLERKTREPQLFLAVIDTCVVVSDDGDTVVRDVKFKDGHDIGTAPIIGPTIRESITHFTPLSGSALHTFQSTASPSRVLNIVSSGVNGELYLTYTFEWDHPEITAGSQEERERQEKYQSTAPGAVEGTLVAIRRMVDGGLL